MTIDDLPLVLDARRRRWPTGCFRVLDEQGNDVTESCQIVSRVTGFGKLLLRDDTGRRYIDHATGEIAHEWREGLRVELVAVELGEDDRIDRAKVVARRCLRDPEPA